MFTVGEFYKLIALDGGAEIPKAEYMGSYAVGNETSHRFKHVVFDLAEFIGHWSMLGINRNVSDSLLETHLHESGHGAKWKAISWACVEKTIVYSDIQGRFDIPRLGDVAEIVIDANTDVKFYMLGEKVWQGETINLVRLGYHSVFFESAAPVTYYVTFKLYKDLEMRRWLATKVSPGVRLCYST